MKILHYIKAAKRMLISFALIMLLCICSNFNSFSNPTSLPPAIVEIYFNNNDFYIELFLEGEDNLNNMRITGLYDTAEFKPGLIITPGQVMVVNKYDFQTSFYINPEGDFLMLEINYGGQWYEHDWYGLGYGNGSLVSAPKDTESIAYQRFGNGYGDYEYWEVKEKPNSIGYYPYQVSKKAAFSGYVKDKNDEPMAGIKVHYASSYYFYYGWSPHVPEIFTDENGYFATNNMFCKKYYISFLNGMESIGDTVIWIEPDSVNYFEFKVDTLLTGVDKYQTAISGYSISNVPNPFIKRTTFIIQCNCNLQFQEGVIKIYNSAGFMIDILPIEITGEKQELVYNVEDKSLTAGVYLYTLEIGKEKKASGKMIISQ